MECKETGKLLSLYLDGEFSDSDKLDIDEHLSGCEQCSRILQEEKEVKNIIANIKLARTPVDLRNQIELVIKGETRSIFVGNVLRYAGAFSLLTVAVISTVVVTRSLQSNESERSLQRGNVAVKMDKIKSRPGKFRPNPVVVAHKRFESAPGPTPVNMVTKAKGSRRSLNKNLIKKMKSTQGKHMSKFKFALTPRMVENLVVKHVRRFPVDIKGKDPRSVAKWYGKRTGYYMVPPKFADGGAKMMGSRLSDFNGGEAIQVIYNIKGRKVTLLMFDPKMMPGIVNIAGVNSFKKLNSSNYLMKTPGGRIVAMFSHKGTGYSIISKQNTNTMISLVKTVILK